MALYNNLTVIKTVELFRCEQKKMEANLLKVLQGETITIIRKKQVNKNKQIKNLITDYSCDNLEFFINCIENILKD